MFQKILVATDGSASSEQATRLALELGVTHRAKVMALNVIDPYPFIGMGSVNPVGYLAYMDAAKKNAADVHQRFMALAQKIAPSVAIDCLMAEGSAVSAGILQTSKEQDCDLIVIGSHGRGHLGRLLLGSVATKVVHESSIPVLISR